MMKEVNSKEKNFKKPHKLFFLTSVITPMTKNKLTRDDPKDIQLFILTIFWDPRCNANLIRVYKCFYINESKTNFKLTHTPPHPPHKYSSPNKVTTDGIINSKQLYHCCSVAKSSPIICDPMDCSILGFSILHYLPGFAQTHIHSVSDAIQPSHSLSPPSPSAFHLSQYQSLFQQVHSLHQVPKVLELQHQSFQWIFRVDFL